MTDNPGYLDSLVDEPALRAYLEERLDGISSFSIEYHQGGNSNETFFLTVDGTDLVLRRPPEGQQTETAHNVLREYRVLSALQDSAVPVPEPVLQCRDESVIGSEFYLMTRVEGDVATEEPERFATPAHRRRIGESVIDTLVAIHDVDYERRGLEDLGRPSSFTSRQVERWSEQLAWVTDQTPNSRVHPTLDRVREWLQDTVPESHPQTLVHGDYRLDNLVLSPSAPPEIAGVLDWELSTLGDPLTDLGFLLIYWRDPSDDGEPIVPEWTSTFTANDGYPTRRELVERYESRTGVSFENDRFYRTLATFKGAVAGEIFYLRSLEGDTADPLYEQMETRVPKIADRALRISRGDEPL